VTTTIPHFTRLPGQTNERVELARYTITPGERVIYGQRIRGVVRLVDVPAEGRGRRYLIERELTSVGELQAIVADYLDQAARWDAIVRSEDGPMTTLSVPDAAGRRPSSATLTGYHADRPPRDRGFRYPAEPRRTRSSP
jgi:hypothetical protein